MAMRSSDREDRVADLSAEVNAISVAVLRVNIFRDRLSGGCSVFKYCKTLSTSQVTRYLGRGGLRLKIPIIKLDTIQCCPIRTPSIGSLVDEMADRYTLRDLYAKPSEYKEWRKSTTLGMGAVVGSSNLALHQEA